VGLGLAGCGSRELRERLRNRLAGFASLALETDAFIAWLGAHDGEDGAVLILGTGSYGFGRAAGRWCRVGGWGPEISDEASGYAIGREILRATLWALDGRAPTTPLAVDILDRFAGKPEHVVAFARNASPSDYAALAPTAFEHAARGDELALKVVGAAVEQAVAMIRRLTVAGMPAISVTGGLAATIADWLPAEVRARLTAPRADALDGAISMARRAGFADPRCR
jgi:glucosamine kinase